MKKYQVIFIDELQSEIRRFQRYISKVDTNKEFEIIPLEPKGNINDLISEIINYDADAVVTDYILAEHNPDITYTGIDVVNSILDIKDNFPYFILTSFDDDAVKDDIYDVNSVYMKGLMNTNLNEKDIEEQENNIIENVYNRLQNSKETLNQEQVSQQIKQLFFIAKEKEKISFLERIKNQIKHYRHRINTAEQELQYLVEQSNQRKLDSKEEAREIELDNFLEKTIHKDCAIPSQLKNHQGLDDLRKLINNTDKLIEQLKSGK